VTAEIIPLHGAEHAGDPILRIRDLSKRFRSLKVLEGIDLDLHPGRVLAVVGPNGSGKTTLIKSVLGLVRPDGGTMELLGRRLDGGWRYRKDLGYMPQSASFPPNLSGREVLDLLLALREMEEDQADLSLAREFELGDELHRPLRNLSGGTRQKVNAVVAFLFKPTLLILDEPTAGLDPVASGVLKQRIRRDKESGKGFLLTSHIMTELEELADDVAFLLDGRIQFAGPVDRLREETGEDRLEPAVSVLMRRRGSSPGEARA
jgi:Cu-processing system ATP-binding protein